MYIRSKRFAKTIFRAANVGTMLYVQLDKMSQQCRKRVSREEIFENSGLPCEVALVFSETRRVLFHSLHGTSALNSILNWILVVESWKTP